MSWALSECVWTGHIKVKLNTGESSFFFKQRRQSTQAQSGNNGEKESIGMETYQR